jgi:DNA polymerase-3 subunit epsilon
MNYLILDLEVTGDDPGWHDIVALSAVLCDENWQTKSEFSTLIYPSEDDGFKLVAERNPRIDLTELKDAPLPFDALEKFEDWIMKSLGYRPDPIEKEEHLANVVLCGFRFMPTYSFLRIAYLEDNYNWNFSPVMVDLSSILHYLSSQKPLSKNGSTMENLKTVAAQLEVKLNTEKEYLLRKPELIRSCFVALKDYWSIGSPS